MDPGRAGITESNAGQEAKGRPQVKLQIFPLKYKVCFVPLRQDPADTDRAYSCHLLHNLGGRGGAFKVKMMMEGRQGQEAPALIKGRQSRKRPSGC